METLRRALAAVKPGRECGSVVTGFDGFVDEMISLVDERQSLDRFTPVSDIASFGELVSASAGHSSLREIVVRGIHPGGCAVNLGDGLACLGVPVDCFATLGEPPHTAFSEVTDRFRSAHTWGREPGRTLAFEFSDGKLMFSSVSQLAEFTPEDIDRRLEDGAYQCACGAASLIALTDWTLYPHMTGVWELLIERVYSKLPHRPAFFFDLVDPSSRSEPDVCRMLKTLAKFETCGPVTLGLNGGEANLLARLLGLREAANDPGDSARLAEELHRQLALSMTVIHRHGFAIGVSREATAHVPSFHCPRPRKTTGAGDRFNAGFIFGVLSGADLDVSLAVGCACAGFFVREARSPTREELVDFLLAWLGECTG